MSTVNAMWANRTPALAEVMRAATQGIPSDSGEGEFANVLAEGLKQAGVNPAEVDVREVEGSQVSGARQFLVTVKNAVEPAENTPEPLDLTDPVAVLKNALKGAGVDPEPLSLTMSDDLIHYPGGAYRSRQISLGDRGGDVYDGDAVLRTPDVAVIEIMNRLGIRA